jgi:lysozyme
MEISQAGIEMLAKLEGCVLEPYKNADGYLMIGAGHLLTRAEVETGIIGSVSWGGGITKEQAHTILKGDIALAQYIVSSEVEVTLKQFEFDALVSFVFNIGKSAFLKSVLLRKLNQGRKAEVPYEMIRWNKAGGKVVLGLTNRRKEEMDMWSGLKEKDDPMVGLKRKLGPW